MLNRREIINKILILRPELDEKELQQIIQEKIAHARNLLTEEGATYMVANELGLDLSSGQVVTTDMKIKDLVLGANDTTIMGHVVAVSPIQRFTRRDGSEGRVARVVLSDETGTITVVLWDENTGMISDKEISRNHILRIAHGYVRAGLGGNPELNVGRRGVVTLHSSSSAVNANIRANTIKKIGTLKVGDSFVNFVGAVKGFSRVSTFTRSNNQRGQVMRLRLADETGRVRGVFWDKHVNFVKTCRKDDVLEIQGGEVRSGLGSVLEVHVGALGSVKLVQNSQLLDKISSTLTKIRDIKYGLNDVDVLGRVLSIGRIREFQRRSGQPGRVGSMYLMDETGSIRVALWDDVTDVLSQMSVDDILLIEGGNAREGIGGAVELNMGSLGEITINPPMAETVNLPKSVTGSVKVSELKAGMQNVIVEGRLVENPIIRNITTRDGENLRVASLRISDSSGEVDVSLWRDLVDKVELLHQGAELKIINAYVKPGFYGDLEVSSRSMTTVELLETPSDPADLQDLIDDLFSKERLDKNEGATSQQ